MLCLCRIDFNLIWRMILQRNVVVVTVLTACIAIVIGFYFSLVKFYYPGCHSSVKRPEIYTATKSPYLVNFDHVPVHDVCSAHQIWMLVRHGSRTPGFALIKEFKGTLVKTRDEVVKNYDQGRGSLCDVELQGLKEWQPFLNSGETETKEKMLVPQGAREMVSIATRFQKRFPNLFVKPYSREKYFFKYTNTERTKDSADAFTGAIFGDDGNDDIKYGDAVDADPILRFYKRCDKWRSSVKKNPETYKEQRLFVESRPFQETLTNVSERLGFQKRISKEIMITMFHNCAFETSYTPDKPSAWCNVFNEDDFRVIEYYQDLNYYWVDGYGHELSYQSACPAIMDLLQHFDARLHNENHSPNVISYFTHSGTTLKVLCRLGLFQDKEHLRSDNFHSNRNRQWKTSKMGTFATNVAIVLYKCPRDYEVGILIQEKEVGIPLCNGKLRCSYQEFRDNIIKIIGTTCENEKLCKVDK